jgi:hypothetical protein
MMRFQSFLAKVNVIFVCCVLLLLLVMYIPCCDCEPPRVRPGTDFDGSAYWALQIAQPEINSFASDAQLYSILGAVIWKDGRLPANTGTWSFVTWSASLEKKFQITVNSQGGITKSTTDSTNPPITASGAPIPAGWVNSTIVFDAIPAQEITDDTATLIVFNVTNFDEAPDTAVWGINFAGGKNPLVRWDGHYIGTQLN